MDLPRRMTIGRKSNISHTVNAESFVAMVNRRENGCVGSKREVSELKSYDKYKQGLVYLYYGLTTWVGLRIRREASGKAF
jgi:hypothetical protein